MLAFFQHKKQIEELRHELDTLKKAFGNVELEWSEMYDRMRRMLLKISKRQERLDASEDTQPVEGEDVTRVQSTSSLSPRQQQISDQIVARRKKVNGGLLQR